MTRFARARGSKSSNERQPEEATSWGELRKQLVPKQSASENNSKSLPKQQNLLQKNESDKKTAKWAEFAEVPFPTKNKKEKKDNSNMNKKELELSDLESSNPKKLNKKKNKLHKMTLKGEKVLNSEQILVKKLRSKKDVINLAELETIVKNVKSEKVSKEKKQKKRKPDSCVISDNGVTDISSHDELKTLRLVGENGFKPTKKQSKRKAQLQKKCQDDGYISKNNSACARPQNSQVKDKHLVSANEMPPVVNKGVTNNSVQCELPNLSKRQSQRIKANLKKELPSRFVSVSAPAVETGATGESANLEDATVTSILTKRQKRNLKKLTKSTSDSSTSELNPKANKNHKRRKPNQASETSTMLINGQDVEVTMFDGFPIRKEDANRLSELREKMIVKKIPSDEIEVVLKLERRKAEKALAREKRKVCFYCRESGHNLSECPTLQEEGPTPILGTSICFKCGSTEHIHFECRVVRGQNFRFAKCFICGEQGHITRQCPDNPRGLYPNGGGCRACGDVTHLKKDCPGLREEKEQHAITLQTSSADKPEALDDDFKAENDKPANKTSLNKIIKF